MKRNRKYRFTNCRRPAEISTCNVDDEGNKIDPIDLDTIPDDADPNDYVQFINSRQCTHINNYNSLKDNNRRTDGYIEDPTTREISWCEENNPIPPPRFTAREIAQWRLTGEYDGVDEFIYDALEGRFGNERERALAEAANPEWVARRNARRNARIQAAPLEQPYTDTSGFSTSSDTIIYNIPPPQMRPLQSWDAWVAQRPGFRNPLLGRDTIPGYPRLSSRDASNSSYQNNDGAGLGDASNSFDDDDDEPEEWMWN